MPGAEGRQQSGGLCADETAGAGAGDRFQSCESLGETGHRKNPQRIRRCPCQCGGDCQNPGGLRRCSGCGPWTHQRAVLFGESGLGDHPESERGGIHPCDRKRRCGQSEGGGGDAGTDRLRRCDDRTGGTGKSVALPGDPSLSGDRGRTSEAFHGRGQRNDPAPCAPSGGI